ncbi:MAG TPA: hypothetical protein VGR46_05605 [Candidatus Limnocylindria bacterium]|jgi:hypothetical protein|nr:hypothetical protein [Candidatus Limnocylindria bacterium]
MVRGGRLSATAGLLYVVFMLGFIAVLFTSGKVGSEDSQKLAWVSDNASRTGTGALLLGLAGISMLWFVGTLRVVLSRDEGQPERLSMLAFIGGAIYSTFLLLSSFFVEFAVISATIDKYAPAVAVSLALGADLSFFSPGWAFPCSVLVWATALVGARGNAFPRWLSWSSAGLAILLIASAAVTYISGALVILLGLVLFLMWVLATSVVLLKSSTAAAEIV